MIPIQVIVLGGFLFLLLSFILILVLHLRAYCIPTVILRFVGNKGRPTLIYKKAKKDISRGVPRLMVRGYKYPVRDFKAEFYYPTPKGKYGALLLWEFEDQMLTPVIPKKGQRLSPDEMDAYLKIAEAWPTIQKRYAGRFEFDRRLHEGLKLAAVDDVDMDFMVEEYLRVDRQYATLGDWFMKYGGHLALVVVCIALLIGVVLFFQEAPELAAQCIAGAREGWAQQTAGNLVPAG